MSTDWSGDDYATVSELQRTMAQQSLADLNFGDATRVLDIGCGDGFITRRIARSAPLAMVVGVDPSPLMIATAHRASKRDPAGPRYVIGDARRLPFGVKFDAVVSFNALHWVHDQQQALDQIAWVLRPSGWALIQMVCESLRPSVEDVMQDLALRERWRSRFEGFTPPYFHVEPERFADMARGSGLILTNCAVTEREWDFGGRDNFEAWCTVGSGAWTERLDAADRPEFISEAVDRFEQVSGRTGLFVFAQLRALMRLEGLENS